MSKTYLFFSLFAIAIQGLFAFFEMASVSFNKVRLQYYVSKGTKRAIWLNYLLQRPSRLFGTTLIGITTALVIGSECARRFYESIHLDPDWAPLTQVLLVVIFGELAPMFAARRHPEQSAMFCVPLMIILAKILSPFTWTFDLISHAIHRMMGKKVEASFFLSREEVRLAFEEKERKGDEFQAAVGQIFQLKSLNAGQLMIPLSKVQMVSSHASLTEVRHLLSVHYTPILPIYHKYPHNIVAVALLRDLLVLSENKRVIDAAHAPWFVTRDTSVLSLLQQFRHNNQSTAVILEASGQAAGILALDQILSTIFGEESEVKLLEEASHYIERTLSAEMSIAQFNQQFETNLPDHHGDTLNEIILSTLDHFPVKGESFFLGEFEFTIEDMSLRGIKTVSVRSIRK